MYLNIPNIINSYGKAINEKKEIMKWEDFMNKIHKAIEILKYNGAYGRYEPNIVLGISSGGLASADYIVRDAFPGKPILSLYVERNKGNRVANFFNEYNNALVNVFKSKINSGQSPLKILIIDDHLGTGKTIIAAKEYLESELGKELVKLLYFPMCSRNNKFLDDIEQILPYNYKEHDSKIFNINRGQFMNLLMTDAEKFPYLNKEIHLAPKS
jgi:hypoxanthine phosphoribosyltransferase